jgi:hypothetical protein
MSEEYAPKPLSRLMEDFLELDVLTASEETRSALECAIRERIGNASQAEVEQGMHILWKFTRNLSREDCWLGLREQYRHIESEAELRAEIRTHLRETPVNPTAREARENWPRTLEKLKASAVEVAEHFARDEERARERYRTLTEFAGGMQGGNDPMVRYRPPVMEFGLDRWLLEPYDAGIEAIDRFPLLGRITRALEARAGPTALFWGVVGAVHDALSYTEPDGFEREVSDGRLHVLRLRGREGLADLGDFWMWYCEEATAGGEEEAFKRMLAHVEHASSEEIEGLFHYIEFNSPFSDSECPESNLPRPDQLWAKILRRGPEHLSVELLGRAGLYYWSTSPQHHGAVVSRLPVSASGARIQVGARSRRFSRCGRRHEMQRGTNSGSSRHTASTEASWT